MKNKFPTALVILDGFGYRKESDHNAIAHAHMPFFSEFLSDYPWTTLQASGPAVGLPQGYIGNSEVGHLTIGCGTIIKQPLTIINEALSQHSASSIPAFQDVLEHLAQTDATLHIMGLLSNAGVHASIDHLYAFLKAAHEYNIPVVVHPFLDGRDVDPGTAEHYLQTLESTLSSLQCGVIGSVHGRFYAMDRNHNWSLTEKSYRVLTEPQAHTQSWQTVLTQAKQQHMSEEFIIPTQLPGNHYVHPGDALLFYNFRPDRARQLTHLFLNGNGTTIKPFPLSYFITPVSYGAQYHTTTLFQTPKINTTLTQLLHEHGYTVCSIAETEKYAHITYFFNGGRETKFDTETRILISSITHQSYDRHPQMGAENITQATIESLQQDPHDLYIINYANADMVGHTGNFQATVQALECLDTQLERLKKEFVDRHNGILYITGDHGKAEEMFDTTNNCPLTAHTTNPVYFIMIKKDLLHSHTQLPLHQLSDIAPFIAHVLME